MKCPCCHQDMPDAPLVVDLDTNILTDGKIKVRLRPATAEIAFKLVQRMPAAVQHEQLYTASLRRRDAENPQKCVQVQVSSLRYVLKAMGFRIDAAYDSGYRIRPDQDEGVIDQATFVKGAKARKLTALRGRKCEAPRLEAVK